MRSNVIVRAIISFVVAFIVTVVIHLLWNGEPRLIQAVVTGVTNGIIITAVQHYWQNKKKSKSDTSDSQ